MSQISVLKLVDGLFTSKIRYGLQLYGRVRVSEQDPENTELKSIQLVQNKLLRTLNGTRVKDKISTMPLLKNFNMLALNQLNAQMKLLEMWKAINVDKYPLQLKQQNTDHCGATTRADSRNRPCNFGKTNLTHNTSVSDAVRVWNLAPDQIKDCKSIGQAKKGNKNVCGKATSLSSCSIASFCL